MIAGLDVDAAESDPVAIIESLGRLATTSSLPGSNILFIRLDDSQGSLSPECDGTVSVAAFRASVYPGILEVMAMKVHSQVYGG